MTIRDKVAAYAAAVGPVASGELRYPIADAEALELAREVGSSRFPAELATAIAEVDALPARPEDDAALAEWAIARKKAYDGFWNYFESEAVDGVAIIRRR